MSTNPKPQRPNVIELAKNMFSSLKADLISTFSSKVEHSPEQLVAESKRTRPEPANVSVPSLVNRNLLVRSLSGAFYVALNIAAIFLGGRWLALLMALTAGVCCWEFFRLMRSDGKVPNQIVGILFAVLMPLVALVNPFLLEGLIFLLILVLGFWYVIDQHARITDVAVTGFGSLYTGFTLSALVAIRCSTEMPNDAAVILCLGVMASVWFNDAFAYLVGSAIGKHKMVPAISPKKSWEGFIGGLCGSLLVWCLLLLFLRPASRRLSPSSVALRAASSVSRRPTRPLRLHAVRRHRGIFHPHADGGHLDELRCKAARSRCRSRPRPGL